MDQERRVQVVLGEAERTDGLLRFVLEAEGFDMVGLASNDEELSRVLRGARPSVVVLDGGISATAALEARERADGAALVVVWPEGVSAVLAEERVEPSMAIEDLGNAVRRAADRVQRKAEPIRIPEAADPDPVALDATSVEEWKPGRSPVRRRGRRAQVLVAAATWLLVITALTAIATAVPNAIELFSGRGRERPTITPRPTDRRVDEEQSSEDPTNQSEPAGCDDATRGNGADRSDGRGNGDPTRVQGCGSSGGDGGRGHDGEGGRPDDPGSQGNHGQGNHGSGNDAAGGSSGGKGHTDEATETDGHGQGQGNAGGGAGNGEEHGGDSGEQHGNAGGADGHDERGRAEEADDTAAAG